jgi:hypothetical protein
MEAAIAMSKILTDAGVQYAFPGDTAIELLPYIDYDQSFTPSSDDAGKLRRLFTQQGSPFQVSLVNESGTSGVDILFKNEKDGRENLVITLSGKKFHGPQYSACLTATDLQNQEESATGLSKEAESSQNTVKLSPISLFNHRLWTIANQEGTDFIGIDDIDHLTKSFTRELRQHRKDISAIYAKEALHRNPDLENSFTKIGVSLKAGKGKKHSREDEELPPYVEDAGEVSVKAAGCQLGEMNLKDKGK